MKSFVERRDNGEAGWESDLPPAISGAQWPRHRKSGLPLVHGFSLRCRRSSGRREALGSLFHTSILATVRCIDGETSLRGCRRSLVGLP